MKRFLPLTAVLLAPACVPKDDDGGGGGSGFATGPCVDGYLCVDGSTCVAQFCVPGDEETGEGSGTGESGTGEESDSGSTDDTGTSSSSSDSESDTGTTTATSTDDTGSSSSSSSSTTGGDFGNCGWSEADSWYACGFMGEDPNGTPIECPPNLMEGAPNCQASIGFEGCCTPGGSNWYCTDMTDLFHEEQC